MYELSASVASTLCASFLPRDSLVQVLSYARGSCPGVAAREGPLSHFIVPSHMRILSYSLISTVVVLYEKAKKGFGFRLQPPSPD